MEHPKKKQKLCGEHDQRLTMGSAFAFPSPWQAMQLSVMLRSSGCSEARSVSCVTPAGAREVV